MPARLKVFRAPAGFYYAYVAAPSQKAALAAWGADSNLFAQGMAEKVDDPAFTKAPLAHPGIVIKAPRGSQQEHLAALAQTAPKSEDRTKKGKPPSEESGQTLGKRPDRPPAPRPSRAALDETEADLEQYDRALAAELAELEAQRKRIADQIEKRREAAAKARGKLSSRLEKVRGAHEAAMERWRKDA
ncbi:hypothetical protein EDF56_11533 [Novosphingobium sp. PhB165]|uniref:hypothetical protein n=1 Tax=Novosphingobium sp. PhB165 TaxID=2485105 RepID=UPI001050AC87|nr:hypothetical protein [Novosphingobium sp. PhB165]TCM14008.1 hypothetical protein EDF56_11533 [Novosphingobium sp. PhB165]